MGSFSGTGTQQASPAQVGAFLALLTSLGLKDGSIFFFLGWPIIVALLASTHLFLCCHGYHKKGLNMEYK